MDDHRTASTDDPPGDGELARCIVDDAVKGASRDGREDGPPPDGRAAAPVTDRAGRGALDAYLRANESVALATAAALGGDHLRGPVTVAVTDARLLAVSEDGEFLCVGLDRVSAVSSRPRTRVALGDVDVRALYAVGFLVAVAGFLGVLATATSALTPVLTLVTLGAVLAYDHVRDADTAPLPDDPVRARWVAGFDALTERFPRVERAADRLSGVETGAVGQRVARLGIGGLVAAPALSIVAVETGHVTVASALSTVAGTALLVYAFRNADAFDGFALRSRRRRVVRATLEDGSAITAHVDPDARLDVALAANSTAPQGREARPTAD